MIPTPASLAAGSTCSSGLSRKQLRMICTVATPGLAIAAQRLGARLDRDAVGCDPPIRDHLVERLEDRVVLVDLVGGQWSWTRSIVSTPRLRARAVVPGQEGLAVVVLGHLLDAPAHLRGHGQPAPGWRAQQLAAELLAAPVAVDVGGVEEGDARLDGGVEGRARVVGVDLAPVGAELPGPEPNDAGRAAEAPHLSLFHGRILSDERIPHDGRRFRAGGNRVRQRRPAA